MKGAEPKKRNRKCYYIIVCKLWFVCVVFTVLCGNNICQDYCTEWVCKVEVCVWDPYCTHCTQRVARYVQPVIYLSIEGRVNLSLEFWISLFSFQGPRSLVWWAAPRAQSVRGVAMQCDCRAHLLDALAQRTTGEEWGGSDGRDWSWLILIFSSVRL